MYKTAREIPIDWLVSNEYYGLFSPETLLEHVTQYGSSVSFDSWVDLWPERLKTVAAAICAKVFLKTRGYQATQESMSIIHYTIISEMADLRSRGILDEIIHLAKFAEEYEILVTTPRFKAF